MTIANVDARRSHRAGTLVSALGSGFGWLTRNRGGVMAPSAGHFLDVPGARLYYEVRGTGPVLMLVGHPMGVSGFAAIAPLLAEHYTVVTLDPRGFARSTIEDPDQDAEPDLLADDVRRVLEAVGRDPAFVFGSSGGAVTGLALVARHPNHVAALLAHEPPVALLLGEAEQARAAMIEVYDTYRERGIGAAWQKFAGVTGMNLAAQTDDAAPPAADSVAMSNRFFAHGLLPITFYEPDLGVLQNGPARVLIGVGTTSAGQIAHRTASVLAERLGSSLVEFPGGHTGFISKAHEFAQVLRRALA